MSFRQLILLKVPAQIYPRMWQTRGKGESINECAQGFTNRIINARSAYNNRRMGSFGPGCVMPKKAGVKRQLPVQVALDNYERDKKRREANASKTEKAAKGGK